MFVAERGVEFSERSECGMNDKLQRLVGRTVRLKGKSAIAKIERIYSDIEGGVRLDSELDGFKSWNIEDLEVLPANADLSGRSGATVRSKELL